jgi:hypothetical protein
MRVRRLSTGVLAAVMLVGALVTSASAQRGGGFGFGRRMPRAFDWVYDGAFVYCRGAFQSGRFGRGSGWDTDYPNVDLNLPWRTGQLTTIQISKDSRGEPNHVIVQLSDPNLYLCPMVIMQEVGSIYFDAEDAKHLRAYLEKGGFVWVDDFWGSYAWDVWASEIGKVFPDRPIKDVPFSHPLFRMVYNITKKSQIPNIGHWLRTGGNTSERGADSAEVHIRAIMDDNDRIMVLMTHNTDFSDAYEREGENRAYFERFAAEGYSFGVNAIVYALTH